MINSAKTGRWTGVMLVGLVLLTAMFFGLLIGAELHLLVVGFAGLLLFMPMVYLAVFGFEDRAGWLLAGAFGLMYVSQILSSKGIPVGYLMELMVFVFALSSLRKVLQLTAADAALRAALLLFLLYLAILAVSSALGRSQPKAALWQLQYNLKLPLMFALGTLIVATARTGQVLRAVVGWTWLLFLPFLVLEMAAPGVFVQLLGYTKDSHANPLLGFLGRLRGPFAHAGYMALMCGLLAAGAAVQWMQGRGRGWALLALVYTAMVVATGQRQELLALLLVFGLYFLLGGRRYAGWLSLAAVVLLIGALFAALYLERNPFEQLLIEWGGGRDSQLSERAILTQKGLEVADHYFPLGSGLGTYGGAGAQKFDQSLFLDLGFSRYWWFRQGLFIVDTFWPSAVAEAGYAGAAVLLALLLTLWGALLRRAWRAEGESRTMLLLALAALTLLLANSPTSAVLGDPRGAFVLWLIIGCGWRASVVYRATPAESVRHNRATAAPQRYPRAVSTTPL